MKNQVRVAIVFVLPLLGGVVHATEVRPSKPGITARVKAWFAKDPAQATKVSTKLAAPTSHALYERDPVEQSARTRYEIEASHGLSGSSLSYGAGSYVTSGAPFPLRSH